MATTGTKTAHQDQIFKVGALVVNGTTLAGAQTAQPDIAGSLTGSEDGTIANVAAITLATSGGNTYSDTAVNTAVNTAITSINLQHKELLVVINVILARLRSAGILAS